MDDPALRFSNVAWTPPGRTQRAVDGLSLEVAAGQVVVLCGPLGSGKTEALRLAVGLERPDTGTVRVFGRDPADLPSADRARIGYAPGDGGLIANLSLRDNLVLPLRYHRDPPPGEIAGRAGAALALFGVDDLPPGLPAFVPTALRRLVVLARAMILDPQLLVIDDPSDDFNRDSAEQMWGHIVELAKVRRIAVLAAATRAPRHPELEIVPIEAPVRSATRVFNAARASIAFSSKRST
jgi:ABC-type multidrug transport system ATPase subunit